MNARPILSLCIPTFNRADTLELLLSSIQANWRLGDGVEVIVADNASTDRTARVVREAQKRLQSQSLHFIRQPKNVGLDANTRTLAAAARGAYIWVCGSDDILAPGAISRVLDTIHSHPGAVQLWNRSTFDPMRPGSEKVEPFTDWSDRSTFLLDEPGAVERYLDRAHSICAGLSFLSCTIQPLASWPLDDEAWEGTYYTQTYAAWYAVLTGCPLVVRQHPLVRCKVGNHTRRNGESVAHVRLDVTTFRRIARLQMSEADATAVRCLLRHEYPDTRIAELDTRLATDPAWTYTHDLLMQTITGRT